MNEAAILTPSRLITIQRLMERPEWPVLWALLSANFPLDESVFTPLPSGNFDALQAAKRDGQRDVMLFIRKVKESPTPAETEQATLE